MNDGAHSRLLPLADVRILAVEQYGAGPFGSMLLADLGAEVIKVEDPGTGGDVGRHVPPYQRGEDNLFFEALNRNKLSISLDLQNEAGMGVLRDLARVSDAVYFNLRGDVPHRLGLTYHDLCEVNPRIVCCSLSAFGTSGSMVTEPGYDYVVQGLAGWMALTGEPDGPPTKTGLSLVDFSAGMAAAMALVAAVHQARRDGVGADCDIALYDVALSMSNYVGTWHLTAGYEPEKTADSAHPTLVPFQNFQTSNGWMVLGCAKEKFWQRLCAVIERPELASDIRFATFALRNTNRDVLLPMLKVELQRETTENWLSRFRDAGVPCAPILTFAEALVHPMVTERSMTIDYPHPVWGTVRAMASPLKIGTAAAPRVPAPRSGGDTSTVLTHLLKLTDVQVDDLQKIGAFGSGAGQHH